MSEENRLESLDTNRSSPLVRLRGVGPWRYAELLVATSFAVAQPLYSLIGENSTFLVVHGLHGAALVGYALVLLLVPAVLSACVYVVAVLIGERSGEVAHASLLGLALGLTVAPPLNRVVGLGGVPSILVLVGLVTAGTWLFLKTATANKVIRYASFAPALFILFFLFVSPASALLTTEDFDIGASGAGEEVDVVWLVFDQLPLSMMVDSEGRIIEDRYPSFARLAEVSNWYPNATTVSTDTAMAMASTLSGRYAEPGEPPVAAVYPTNVFTLLDGSHEIVAYENVTRLCPDVVCGDAAPPSPDLRVWADTGIVYTRVVLPADVADRFVPPISGRWGGFGAGETVTEGSVELERYSGDDRERMQAFLDDLGTADGPALYYLHQEKPHEPLLFLPDGRIYDGCSCYWVTEEGGWPDDDAMLEQRLQRYVMQSMAVDRDLGRVMDRLAELGLFEETMLIVMSDHGASFLPGNLNRTYTETNRDEVLPVPMFVKFPGQTVGVEDERAAQVTDLLPTVLDVVAVDEGLGFVGESLLDPAPENDATHLIGAGGVGVVDPAPRVMDSPMVPWIESVLPEPDDPFLFGPNRALIGRRSADLVSGRSSFSASLATLDRLSSVNLDADYVPAHVIGELTGADAPVPVAVAVNGVVGGVGTTFENDLWRISVMVDPRYLREGANEVELFEVTSSGLSAIEVG